MLLLLGLVPHQTAPVTWDSEAVAKILKRKGIRGRGDLARICNLPRATIYRQFDENWNGNPTTAFLGAVAVALGVSPNRLIADRKAA